VAEDRGGTIVVVDDDPAFLELLETLLGSENYRVITHQHGHAAFELVKATLPDLLILDWWLADAAGEDVLALLASDHTTARVPVLICSAALPSRQAIPAPLGQPTYEILLKPFDIETLLQAVRRLTG